MAAAAAFAVPDAYAFLAASAWRLTRRVCHSRSGALEAAAEGVARFVPVGDAPQGPPSQRVLRYAERGTFYPGGAAAAGASLVDGLPFRQEYEYRFGGTDGGASAAVAVHFPDGRPFVELDLRSGACVARHWCAPDTYDGRWRVGGPDVFTTEFVVEGPAKQHRIVTDYARLTPGGDDGV
jgi:hypothetical protein